MVLALLVVASTLCAPGLAASGPPKHLVERDRYGEFERLAAAALAPDGHTWSFERRFVGGDRTLVVHRRGARAWEIPWGTGAVFARDSRHLAYQVTPSADEVKQLEKDDEPVIRRAEVLRVADGERRALGEAASVAFDPTGRFLAVQGVVAPGAERYDVHLHDLEAGTATVFGNVLTHVWHEAHPLLALTVGADGDRGNALQVVHPESGRVLALAHTPGELVKPVWHDELPHLAVLREAVAPPIVKKEKDEDDEDDKDDDHEDDDVVDETAYQLMVWRHVAGLDGELSAHTLEEDTRGLPEGSYVTGDTAPQWSSDGRRVSLGIRQAAPEVATSKESEESEESGKPEVEWNVSFKNRDDASDEQPLPADEEAPTER